MASSWSAGIPIAADGEPGGRRYGDEPGGWRLVHHQGTLLPDAT